MWKARTSPLRAAMRRGTPRASPASPPSWSASRWRSSSQTDADNIEVLEGEVLAHSPDRHAIMGLLGRGLGQERRGRVGVENPMTREW